MKPGLPIGAQYQEKFQIDDSCFAKTPKQFGGQVIHPLLGTAPLIEALEWVSRQILLPYLEDDEEGVGATIELRHLAPVPNGENIDLQSNVVEVSERHVKTHIQALHQETLIADGYFTQVVVSKEKLTAYSAQTISTPLPQLTLFNSDRNYQFGLELLRWETPFPCTPYDEWLICRAILQSPLGMQVLEGPLLLRIEVESIYEALKSRISSTPTQNSLPFESDFLEPALKLTITQNADQSIIFGVTCQPSLSHHPNLKFQSNIADNDEQSISFPMDTSCIIPWCEWIESSLQQLQTLL